MDKIDVRIVQLAPIRVASAYGFGNSPEDMASRKMETFLKSKGIFEANNMKYRSFGFDNPSPSLGSPNYGYEVWVEIGPEVEPEGDIRIEEFPGGMYAVTRFEGLENIGRVWKALVNWRETSAYKCAKHQWLENLLNPQETDTGKYIFDLYLPIAE